MISEGQEQLGPPFEIISICKGGGYRYCRTKPLHPKANSKGLYPLHRVLVENKIGRLLTRSEDVHHEDENKENDDLENLIVKSGSQHAADHKTVDCISCRCPCGKSLELKPHTYRQRLQRSKRGVIFCSLRCAANKGLPS